MALVGIHTHRRCFIDGSLELLLAFSVRAPAGLPVHGRAGRWGWCAESLRDVRQQRGDIRRDGHSKCPGEGSSLYRCVDTGRVEVHPGSSTVLAPSDVRSQYHRHRSGGGLRSGDDPKQFGGRRPLPTPHAGTDRTRQDVLGVPAGGNAACRRGSPGCVQLTPARRRHGRCPRRRCRPRRACPRRHLRRRCGCRCASR
jgi:hypothetical protein